MKALFLNWRFPGYLRSTPRSNQANGLTSRVVSNFRPSKSSRIRVRGRSQKSTFTIKTQCVCLSKPFIPHRPGLGLIR